jgi:DNA-binding NarL/FixJ family response regulator
VAASADQKPGRVAAAVSIAAQSSSAFGPQAPASPLDALTQRECQILEHLARGASNKEIGRDLGLTEKTIKHYVTNILEKLQVRNRVEAALLAHQGARG